MRPLVQVQTGPQNQPLTSKNVGRSALRCRPTGCIPIWDEVLRALPILSQKNAPEQPHCDPTVVGMPWMVGCTAVSEPIRVNWTISWTPRWRVTPSRSSPSRRSRRCSRRSWRSVHAADADNGVTADVLVRLSMTLGFISYRYLTITVGPDGHGRSSQQRSLGLDPVRASVCAGRPRGWRPCPRSWPGPVWRAL